MATSVPVAEDRHRHEPALEQETADCPEEIGRAPSAVERLEDVPETYVEAFGSHELLAYTLALRDELRIVRQMSSIALTAIVRLTAQLEAARGAIRYFKTSAANLEGSGNQ
jgi:hypothetical protein